MHLNITFASGNHFDFTLDSMWSEILRILPKYMNSHYYDIMSYVCGIMGFLIMLLFRKRIKNATRNMIEKKYSYDLYRRSPVQLRPIMVYRRWNLIIPVMAGIISSFLFQVVAVLSERIDGITWWVLVVPFVPISVYTLYEMWESGIFGAIASIVVFILVEMNNYSYSSEVTGHHKICYAIRTSVIVYGLIGFVLQIIPPWNDWKRYRKEQRRHDEGSQMQSDEKMKNGKDEEP